MEELDFTKPQPPAASPSPAAAPSPAAPPKAPASPFYDPVIAGKVFRAFGKAERFTAGATLFQEDQKVAAGGFFARGSAARMYYVEQGSVALVAGGRPLDTVGAGEVIGEMAVISGQPRSATAVARADCAVFSMGAEELKGALARMPEFAMMLMSVIFDRLRLATARLAARRATVAARADEPPVFPPELLRQLQDALPRSAAARFWPDSVIMREGQTGTCLYVVQEGTVAIAVREKVVALVNPGGTFGEMALVDQSPRSATAIAKTECELLSIDRASLVAAIKAQPAFAMAMLRAFADRLRHANAQVG